MNRKERPQCCFCGYRSSARGVDVHMAMKHKDILTMMRKVIRQGRLPDAACRRCGMIHQRFPRDGWFADRRKLERSGKVIKSAFAFGRIPPGYRGRGEKLHLATLTPPKGTNRIVGVMFFSEATPSQFHLTASGKEYTFDVHQGDVRGVHVRKVA